MNDAVFNVMMWVYGTLYALCVLAIPIVVIEKRPFTDIYEFFLNLIPLDDKTIKEIEDAYKPLEQKPKTMKEIHTSKKQIIKDMKLIQDRLETKLQSPDALYAIETLVTNAKVLTEEK